MLSIAHEATVCECARVCCCCCCCCQSPWRVFAQPPWFGAPTHTRTSQNLWWSNVYSRYTNRCSRVYECVREWLCFLHSLHFIWFAPLLLCKSISCVDFVWGVRAKEQNTQHTNHIWIASYDTSKRRSQSAHRTEMGESKDHHMRSICKLMMMFI